MGPKRVNKLPKIVVSNVTAHTSMSESNAMTEGAASEEDAITATKKELLSDKTKDLLVLLGFQVLCIWGIMSGANWIAEAEQLTDEYIFEQGQELGYNWTEYNMTVFETTTSTGSFSEASMHEVMCSNGVEQGCDYMIAADTADKLYGVTPMQEMIVAVAVFVQLFLVVFWLIAIKNHFD